MQSICKEIVKLLNNRNNSIPTGPKSWGSIIAPATAKVPKIKHIPPSPPSIVQPSPPTKPVISYYANNSLPFFLSFFVAGGVQQCSAALCTSSG